MDLNLFTVFSLFLVAGILVPAYAQTNSDNVVINELDVNPPGNDALSISEWVELYNPTGSDIDLSGWQIASTTVLKKTMIIPDGTIIEPEQFLTYSYQSVWFTDSNESVELRDENGVIVDKTPALVDIQNDFTSWQRIYDGFDFDSFNDWKFVTSTAGSSNGKLVDTQESEDVIVLVFSEKPSYLFGDTAVISGSVSEEVFIVKPFFQSKPIIVNITGPNFDRVITLYPDLDLNFETTLNLNQVLGINEGTYDVSVNYAGAIANTSFYVGIESIEQIEQESHSFSVITDKSQYIPGQQVSITAFASETIPFEGMIFSVTDSQNHVISNGNLYPTNGEFTTSIFLNNIDPDYGTYTIHADYSDKSVVTTFEVIPDLKEDVLISLWTDKIAYGLGEEVNITGRLNQVWINTLDLEIIQTRQSAIGNSSIGSDTGFKILDGIQIAGDGSFTYAFTIPNDSTRLGDYRINVSKDLGSASAVIHAVPNPGEFTVSDISLTINSDKEVYEPGDVMTIGGLIEDPFSNSSYDSGVPVRISINHEDGSPIEIVALQSGSQTRNNDGITVAYDFTTIPETSGNYSVKIDATRSVFTEGTYVVKAQYFDDVATKTFSIIDNLDLDDGAIISLDKDVYGLGETVYLTGLLPPTGNSAVDISLTKPDGTKTLSGTIVDNQHFSWSWVTPVDDKFQNIQNDERNIIKSIFGIYKLQISTDSHTRDLFFKVSKDPANDSISETPIFVTTEKSLYKAGEKLKVVGNVIKREQGDEGLVIPERITIQVLDGEFPYKQIHESAVYPNQGGDFSSLFELPATIFDEGSYTVKALYIGTQADATFGVTNDFVFGLDEPVTLLLSVDKSEYGPGDIVTISGKPNKLIYLEKFDVSVTQKSDADITCGSFYCGTHNGSIFSIRPSPSGSFTHQFMIPNSVSSIGTYEITVDADFETKSIQFDVVGESQTPKLDTVIEKENRIPERTISIFTEEKIIDHVSIAPRVLTGSLITPLRGDESNVNLKVTTVTGTCIIGPDADCLVRESTRKPGQIYDVVKVDGVDLKVRYSGYDTRLEKFSILPESSIAFLPDANWNIEILKDEQVSRFYYKVTYKALE
ncbi:MAG: lamin tail domain-containing protein [Nitrosopumilus sp.]